MDQMMMHFTLYKHIDALVYILYILHLFIYPRAIKRLRLHSSAIALDSLLYSSSLLAKIQGNYCHHHHHHQSVTPWVGDSACDIII